MDGDILETKGGSPGSTSCGIALLWPSLWLCTTPTHTRAFCLLRLPPKTRSCSPATEGDGSRHPLAPFPKLPSSSAPFHHQRTSHSPKELQQLPPPSKYPNSLPGLKAKSPLPAIAPHTQHQQEDQHLLLSPAPQTYRHRAEPLHLGPFSGRSCLPSSALDLVIDFCALAHGC